MVAGAWHAGLIIPSSNRLVEQEMVPAFPKGLVPHVTRLRMTGPHRLELEALIGQVAQATMMLADARCDAVAFHCTASAMEHGLAGEARIEKAMQAAGARVVSTTASAMRRALHALSAYRIVLVTPYDDAVSASEADFLRQDGFEVLHTRSFALGGSEAYSTTPASFWPERLAAERDVRADAYILSCANLSVIPAIAAMEDALDRPVVTSNLSVLWDLMARAGHTNAGGLPGRLFDHGLAA